MTVAYKLLNWTTGAVAYITRHRGVHVHCGGVRQRLLYLMVCVARFLDFAVFIFTFMEFIYTYIAERNSSFLGQYWIDPKVAVNYWIADLSAREKAMLDFALTVCRSETVTEEHFSALEAHGFDREDIWDIAAFFAMSNRLANVTDMRPNTEFNKMGSVLRDKAKASDGQSKSEQTDV